MNGDVVGATTIAHDIGNRKKEDEHMRRLAEIVGASQDAMLSRTLDGTTLTWNDAAERLVGHSAEEMIGTPPLNLLGRAGLPADFAAIRAAATRCVNLQPIDSQLGRKLA